MLGAPEDEILTVEIPAVKNISALRDIIKEKFWQQFQNTQVSRIRLSTAFRPYNEIKDTKFPSACLNPLVILNHIFHDLNPAEVHVIIAPPGK